MPESAYAHILRQSGISPCFNPQKMELLELLYMDENNNVVQGTLQKMMVQRRVLCRDLVFPSVGAILQHIETNCLVHYFHF